MKKSNTVVALSLSSLFLAGAANASVASEAAFDSILSEFTALESKAWLVVVPVVLAVISIKLFKKFANKAT